MALRLENSLAGELTIRNGELVTSKPDKKNHGYGSSEIKDIVQRYNGYMHYQQEKDKFQLDISVPLAE